MTIRNTIPIKMGIKGLAGGAEIKITAKNTGNSLYDFAFGVSFFDQAGGDAIDYYWNHWELNADQTGIVYWILDPYIADRIGLIPGHTYDVVARMWKNYNPGTGWSEDFKYYNPGSGSVFDMVDERWAVFKMPVAFGGEITEFLVQEH